MSDNEDYSGLITARIEKIAREIIREEIPNCRQGIENKSKLIEHERRFDDMNETIKQGFKEIKEKFDKKESHVWDIILVILNAVVLIFIAVKIH